MSTNDEITHAIITDRGRDWEQLRYQINVEGDDFYEEAEDSLRTALGECEKLQADKVTMYTYTYFDKMEIINKIHAVGDWEGTKKEFFALRFELQEKYKKQYNERQK